MNGRKGTRLAATGQDFWFRLLSLAFFFVCGVLLGQALSARGAEGTAGELREYLEGYLSLPEEKGFWEILPSSLFLYFRYPVLAFLLGYLGAGVALLPLSAAAFGFSLSFSVCCFTAAFGGAGVLLAMAVFGIRSLVSIPGFFLLAVPALRSAALRSQFPFGRGKRVASSGNDTGRWKGLCAVSAALLAALLLESALSSGLLRLVWEHFIAA